MKTLICWLLLCLLTFSARAQVQLGQETFEGLPSDVGYTSSTPFSIPTNDPAVLLEYFQLIDQVPGANYVPYSRSPTVLGNQQGQRFLGGGRGAGH